MVVGWLMGVGVEQPAAKSTRPQPAPSPPLTPFFSPFLLTFIEYAIPRTRFTIPSSTICIAGSSFRHGTRSATSPPPPGRAPRLTMRSSRPSSSPAARRSRGRVTVRKTSTDGSNESLVTPRSVMERGCGGMMLLVLGAGGEGGGGDGEG